MADVTELPTAASDAFPSKDALESAMSDAPTQEELDLAALPESERQIGAKLLPGLVARISQKAEAQKAKKLAEEIDILRTANEKQLRETVAKIQQNMAPPDDKQLEKLLNQEYATFDMQITLPGPNKETKMFVICELPQFYEKKIAAIVTQKLVPFLKDVQAIDFKSSGTVADRLSKVMSVIPEAFDCLSEVAAIALDPRSDSGISAEWVQKNISSHRIAAIVEAQFVVNKLRDFMSAAYRLIPS
jgi:hypothetical protein